LDRKRDALAPSLSRFDFSGFFFCAFVKDIVGHEKVRNMNELRDRFVIAEEGATSEMSASIRRETGYRLMNVVPLRVMASILLSTKNIRNFERSNF
jgi:hypothetical protein